MRDYVFFISLALFWVYMKRQGRWGDFLGAIEGKYQLPSLPSS